MQVPLVDLKTQYKNIKDDVDQAIKRVITNTSFIMGPEVSGFEKSFAGFLRVPDFAGVASGTAALILALDAADVGPGHEVITTSHTFMATGEAIVKVGARPVFVDINEDDYCMDPDLVEAAVTPNTKAIIAVHLYGHPAPMDRLREIADRHGLILIEDAAQAHGAEFDGKRCGTLGDLACFSFYPGKNLGAYGDGGGVSGRQDLLDKVRLLSNHGRTTKYEHEIVGYGERLDAMQAAILAAKLPLLEDWNKARRAHALRYNELLKGLDLITPMASPRVRHVYHLYVVRVKNRDRVLQAMKDEGVGVGVHYPIPLHRQPAFLAMGYQDVRLPVTEKVVDEVLSLPIYPEISEKQIKYICDVMKKVLS